jgi:hypothetical protein
LLAQQGDPGPEPLLAPSPLVNSLQLMDQISQYAKGLQAIVDADTESAVDVSINSVDASLLKLAALVKPSNPNFESFSVPVSDSVKWIAGQYINSVKLDALRTATRNANPLIMKSVDIFRHEADAADKGVRATLAEEVSVRKDSFKSTHSATDLTNWITAARAYDAVLTSPPASTVFAKLADAHDALTKALSDNSISLETLFTKLDELKRQAKELQKIASEFMAARKSSEEHS